MIKVILLSVLLTTTADVESLKQNAKDAFDKAESKFMDKPVNPDVVKECPCKGKGYIIQGDGHKSDCPGTSDGPCKFLGQSGEKVIKIMPAKEHGVIIMETRPGCVYCEKIKKSEILKKLINVGWKFREVQAKDSVSVPRLGVMMFGEYNPISSLTIENITKINNKYKDRNKK